ncbi:hypothetical protein TIFTF001_029715 [Ficus carica]|uniref:Uncharacterized protein n=1 Tax=Ficus carica TaxID=3494 RepID=A0AA88J2S8_FICCA|nr:hypothetical protein TIFTF001_029715 [Ficus carica]
MHSPTCSHQSLPEIHLGVRTPAPTSPTQSLSFSFYNVANSMKKCKSVSVSVSSPQKKVANRSPQALPALAAEEEEEAEMASLIPSRTSSGFGFLGGIATGENVRLIILIGGGAGGAGAGEGNGGDGENGDGDGGGGSGEDENWDWRNLCCKIKTNMKDNEGVCLQIRGDVVKAEEYRERAILARPRDGNVLSMYGDLIWHLHKDGPCARNCFNQALLHAPRDCSVVAAYANFLWDAGDEADENKIENQGMDGAET